MAAKQDFNLILERKKDPSFKDKQAGKQQIWLVRTALPHKQQGWAHLSSGETTDLSHLRPQNSHRNSRSPWKPAWLQVQLPQDDTALLIRLHVHKGSVTVTPGES